MNTNTTNGRPSLRIDTSGTPEHLSSPESTPRNKGTQGPTDYPENNSDSDNIDSANVSEHSDYGTNPTSHEDIKTIPKSPSIQSMITEGDTISSSESSAASLTDNSAFTWAFFNCPATLNLAGMLLLAGGLFVFSIGFIAASAPIVTVGAVIAGVGGLLGIWGQFNGFLAKKTQEENTELSLDNELSI